MRNTLDNAVFGKAGVPQKPVVPKFVAEYLNYCMANELTLIEALNVDNTHLPLNMRKIVDWLFSSMNQDIFACAWLDGYEVEKEQFYEVVFREDESDRYLLMELGEKCYEIATESENDGYRTQCFTESEIKAIDERYWSFAVPVEEVTNAVLSAFAKRRLEQEEDAE